MRTHLGIAALTSFCLIAAPTVGFSKGSGGHGGGHSGGGHAGGGGHASGAHGGGRAGSGSHQAAGSAAPARAREGRPVVGYAVPRSSGTSPFSVPPSFYAPRSSYPYLYQYRSSLLYPGLFSLYTPFYFGSSYGTYEPLMDEYGDYIPPLPYGAEPPLPLEESARPAAPSGNIRLIVEPDTTQVFVDGYYVGVVDDFLNTLAGLKVDAGAHHLEFRAEGYEPLIVDLKVDANATITYRATLRRLKP
jgi:hypothetical protein